VTQTISLALEGSAPERMVSAELALFPAPAARTTEPKAQPAASFAGLFLVGGTLERHLYFLNAGPETSTRWTTCAVMQCTESCVLRGMHEECGTLINAGDLL
jgi:hypothetical protein